MTLYMRRASTIISIHSSGLNLAFLWPSLSMLDVHNFKIQVQWLLQKFVISHIANMVYERHVLAQTKFSTDSRPLRLIIITAP